MQREAEQCGRCPLARRNQFSTRRDHVARCFYRYLALFFSLGNAKNEHPREVHWMNDGRWLGQEGRRREEILRSERNGVPVMGSPGISLKCRGLSIIRGQPLLHPASRSAGDQSEKGTKRGWGRWKRTSLADGETSTLLLSFSHFRSFLLSYSFSLVPSLSVFYPWSMRSRSLRFEKKKKKSPLPTEIRDF